MCAVGDAALRGSLPGDSPPSIYPLLHESTPLSKLSSIVSLAVAAALLAGCSTATEEPDVRSAATESASPSATPTEEETVTPEPAESPSEEPVEPSSEPSPEPVEPIVETPSEPAPELEPLPAGPNDPFVPPPHGEPNPLAPQGPGTPHVNPDYFDWVKVTPVQGDLASAPTATVQQGQTLAVIGDGYAPGQRVYVMLGWPQSDYNYILEPATAVADQNGYFIYPVAIGSNVPPRDYVVMTVPLDVDAEVRETLKRYHNVIITAAQ